MHHPFCARHVYALSYTYEASSIPKEFIHRIKEDERIRKLCGILALSGQNHIGKMHIGTCIYIMWNWWNMVTDIDAKDWNTGAFEGNGGKDGFPIGLKVQLIRL